VAKKSKQWISVYRSLLEQPYARKPQYLSIWIYLLLNASYTNREIIRNNEKIKLKRGELVITYRELSDFFGIATVQVFKILHYFQRIEQLQVINLYKGVNGCCKIKILNYLKYQSNMETNKGTFKGTFDNSVNDDISNNYVIEDFKWEHSKEQKREHLRTNKGTFKGTFDNSVNDDISNNYEMEDFKREHLREHLRERSTSPNSTDFAPENVKAEKALNIIYRKKVLNKGEEKNIKKEDFYFSSPFLKNSILSIFKEEYNESRGMDYIVLNEQKELSAIQGLLTAYRSQNGNSEYTGEKILDEFRAYFKKCLRIQNNFYKTNLSLSLIANKFNEIIQVIKKEGIEDPEVEAINREEFYNNLKLH